MTCTFRIHSAPPATNFKPHPTYHFPKPTHNTNFKWTIHAFTSSHFLFWTDIDLSWDFFWVRFLEVHLGHAELPRNNFFWAKSVSEKQTEANSHSYYIQKFISNNSSILQTAPSHKTKMNILFRMTWSALDPPVGAYLYQWSILDMNCHMPAWLHISRSDRRYWDINE